MNATAAALSTPKQERVFQTDLYEFFLSERGLVARRFNASEELLLSGPVTLASARTDEEDNIVAILRITNKTGKTLDIKIPYTLLRRSGEMSRILRRRGLSISVLAKEQRLFGQYLRYLSEVAEEMIFDATVPQPPLMKSAAASVGGQIEQPR